MPRTEKGTKYLYKGESLLVREISDKCGVPAATLYQRIARKNRPKGSEVDDLALPSKRKKAGGTRRSGRTSQVGRDIDLDLKKSDFISTQYFQYGFRTVSLQELSDQTGLPRLALFSVWYSAGGTGDMQAHCWAYRRNSTKLWQYKGELATVNEIARWVGKTPALVHSRLWHASANQDQDIAQIVDEKPKSRRRYFYGGCAATVAEIAEWTGLRPGYVQDKLRDANAEDGMDITGFLNTMLDHRKGPLQGVSSDERQASWASWNSDRKQTKLPSNIDTAVGRASIPDFRPSSPKASSSNASCG